MKLIISSFLPVIISNAIQSQSFAPIFDASKNHDYDTEAVLAIKIMESAIIPKIKDVELSFLKIYDDETFKNKWLHLLISLKLTLDKQLSVQT